MSFDSLGLSAELLRAISDQGYTVPTSVQSQTIPVILQGRDILAGSQTGTGKTASFTLPVLQRLNLQPGGKGRLPRALILTPTRELTAQVGDSVRAYGKYLPMRAVDIYGGVSFHRQTEDLRRGADVIIATPGRLLDHVGQRTIDLSRIEVVVLDEADRMLDMGFIQDIRRILAVLPGKRQNLLFSATFSEEIKRLASGLLHNPAEVAVTRQNTTAEQITQVVYPVDKERKRALLSYLIGSNDWRQVLVFSRTKHGANRLAEQLEDDGIRSAAIHGNKSQSARTRALADFKDGKVRVLVATDIAARGIDINQLPHVVNYDLPNVPEDYVHRIGRTGRAGNNGEAISLVSADEGGYLWEIQRLIKREIPSATIPGFEPTVEVRVSAGGTPGVRPAASQRRPQNRQGTGARSAGGARQDAPRPAGRQDARRDGQRPNNNSRRRQTTGRAA